MAFYIKPHSANPYGFRYANHTDINLYFGIEPGRKVDRDFFGMKSVPLMDGRSTTLFYGPGAPMRMGNYGRMIKSSKHRVTAMCPDCGAHVPAGRTHQHKCK